MKLAHEINAFARILQGFGDFVVPDEWGIVKTFGVFPG